MNEINLTKDSKFLLNLYKNNFHLWNDDDKKISSLTSKIFREFYDLFLKSKQFTDAKNIKIEKLLKLPQPNDKSQYLYIVKNIRNEIEETFNSFYKFSFTITHRKINIYISGKNITETFVKSSLYKIIFWLYVVTSFNNNNDCSRNLSIYLYFTLQKKNIPSGDNEVLEKQHVNTGFTYTCIPDSQIIIYRLEEWFKVFIHETIHNFGLDFSADDITRSCVLKTFQVQSVVNLFEAYTDSWARILNILSLVYLSLPTIDFDSFQKLSHQFILYETTHSFIQTYKILDKMGLKYIDLFDSNKGSKYKEKTNVLSYYVINSILYSNYQAFLQWCIQNNINTLKFDTEKQIDFCHFVTDLHKSKVVLDKINYVQLNFQKININSLLKNNMRKSMFQVSYNNEPIYREV